VPTLPRVQQCGGQPGKPRFERIAAEPCSGPVSPWFVVKTRIGFYRLRGARLVVVLARVVRVAACF
jgi:hypothetical protein